MADMTRVLVVSAVLSLSGCASTPPGEYRQAVARPAPAGPLIVQQPPSYPGATYTPAGAGAYRGDPLPSKPVPRSPNKRVLPPTKEPGLWAADGEAVAGRSARLFGVDIPYMKNEHGVDAAGHTEWCAKTVSKAADDVGVRSQVESESPLARACMAAQAYLRCATGRSQWISGSLTPDQRTGSAAYHEAKATLEHARSIEALFCHGVELSAEQKQALRTIYTQWNTTFEESL